MEPLRGRETGGNPFATIAQPLRGNAPVAGKNYIGVLRLRSATGNGGIAGANYIVDVPLL
jgi:hypothetical protein